MLPFRRLAPAFRCLFSVSRPISSSVCRRNESTILNADEQEQEQDDDEEGDIQEALTERNSGPASYKQFLEEIGYRYKFASPQQWLGGKPFPMNPSFRPPPPISDEQRETIYRLYWVDPKFYNIRKLSSIFSISLKRVTAILRLKKLEKSWKKEGKELQTGFLFGMERLLKAHTHNAVQPLQDSLNLKERVKKLESLDVHNADLNEQGEQRDWGKVDSEKLYREAILDDSQEPFPPIERLDVHKADINEEEEQRDLAKVDFKQLYWETIPEDRQEPILPLSLQEARNAAISDKIKRKAKANAKFVHRIPDTAFIKTPTYKVLTLPRESRPTTRFVNVGSAFMNARELAKRQVVSLRNSRMRAMKSLEKKDRFVKK